MNTLLRTIRLILTPVLAAGLVLGGLAMPASHASSAAELPIDACCCPANAVLSCDMPCCHQQAPRPYRLPADHFGRAIDLTDGKVAWCLFGARDGDSGPYYRVGKLPVVSGNPSLIAQHIRLQI